MHSVVCQSWVPLQQQQRWCSLVRRLGWLHVAAVIGRVFVAGVSCVAGRRGSPMLCATALLQAAGIRSYGVLLPTQAAAVA